MILVRNTFQVKFGKIREATAAWKEVRDMIKKSPGVRDHRILTDVTGPAYTLVAEFTYDSLAEFEKNMTVMRTPEWQAWYQKLVPFMEASTREIMTIVE
jgi:hypothetical protein